MLLQILLPLPFYRYLDFFRDYPGERIPERSNQSGFTGARDSEWQWHQLGHMQISTSPHTDNHASTTPPNQQHQRTEGMMYQMPCDLRHSYISNCRSGYIFGQQDMWLSNKANSTIVKLITTHTHTHTRMRTCTHTYTHFKAFWTLSWITHMSWYQDQSRFYWRYSEWQ